MGFRRVTKGKPWPPVALWRPLKKVLTIYVSENRIYE